MANHSQKLHNGSSSKNINNSNNTEGIAAIVSKLNSLGRDMKKLKENVHAIQRLSMASLEDLPLSAMELNIVWALLDTTHALTIAHCLEKKAKLEGANEQAPGKLTKEFHAKTTSGVPTSSVDQCKAVYANDEAPIDNISINETDEVSDIANNESQVAQEEDDVPTKVFPCQLSPKELNPRSFTLSCTIRRLNFYAMTDLGASINVIPVETVEGGRGEYVSIKKTLD
ncbi:hypothetical protein Tco_1141462 [Tanacetum coccineum]